MLELALLQSVRARLAADNVDFLSLDESVGQFALDLAGDALREFGIEDALNGEDYITLVETVAAAIAIAMHVAFEATATALDLTGKLQTSAEQSSRLRRLLCWIWIWS
jgi:hypothetical protein